MFATEARNYIKSLISIQGKIRGMGYERSDQRVVNECISIIQPLINRWKYSSNQKMANFWIKHREEIRYMVPTSNYKGFKALLYHFECLDRDSKIYQYEPQLIVS